MRVYRIISHQRFNDFCYLQNLCCGKDRPNKNLLINHRILFCWSLRNSYVLRTAGSHTPIAHGPRLAQAK